MLKGLLKSCSGHTEVGFQAESLAMLPILFGPFFRNEFVLGGLSNYVEILGYEPGRDQTRLLRGLFPCS